MRYFSAWKFEQGFSLVEIILVGLVVGFIVILVGQLPSSINLIGQSQHAAIARQIVSQQIENTRLKSYLLLANGSSAINDPRLSSLPHASGTMVIADCPPSICQNGESVKQITVTISWLESRASQSINLTTLIADGGLK